MPRAFISHSTKDRAFVENELIRALADGGVETWYARDDISTASEWERSIRQGLETCDWFLLVMTPRSAESHWVRIEVGWAMDFRQGRIIPVYAEECNRYQFHLGVPLIQHIDFRGDRAEARRRLLKLLLPEVNNPLDLRDEQERQRPELRQLYAEALALKRALNLPGSGVGPSMARSLREEGGRRQVAALRERGVTLPAAGRAGAPALLNALGQFAFAAGDFEAAQADFRAAAAAAAQPRARAEAHHNAYLAGLESEDWEGALADVRAAAADDPERWAPFPLSKYEPMRVLGAGGFGALFLCRHRYLGTPVTVKALLRDGDGAAFGEAALLEEVDHPALVRVRDGDFARVRRKGEGAVEERQRPFLVLDYFDAPDLQRYVEEHGPLTPADLLTVACPLAEALLQAHLRYILHRDVKPANVLLRRDRAGWRVKLIDFGLARRAHGAEAPELAGTPDYAPPEQMGRRGEPVGPAADIYAFARTCCFALFRTPQPLRRHWQQLPEPLADLLDRCLAEAPADRPRHFGEVLPELYRLRDELGATPAPSVLWDIAEDAWFRLKAQGGEQAALQAELEALAQMPNEEARQAAQEAVAELGALEGDDLRRVINQMVDQLQAMPAAAAPRGTLLRSLRIASARESELVRQLLARYHSLPEDQRRAASLLDAVGKLQVAVGDYAEADQTFRELAAGKAAAPEQKAEAHHNLYRVALERRDWDAALRELLEACRLAPARFAPFPLDVLEPSRILGAGGFGVAFLCHDRARGDTVVVKALAADLGAEEVNRLWDEVRVLAGLTHPAVLRPLGGGYADKAGKARPFLVLEYFAGSPLEDVVNREGPLSVADMTEVGRQAALGLQACHEAGLLHGRVSPEAVLVARQPGGWQAKVTDFYGRPPRGVPSHTIGFTTRNRTLLGASFVGTLQYAAPEQMGRLQGAVPGPASDIYGWGRTFCFGLFGRAEPGPNDWKSLPAGLGDLLEDCLAADPGARPANFAAVVARLPGCRV